MKTFSAKLNTVYLVIMYLVFTGKYRFDMEKEQIYQKQILKRKLAQKPNLKTSCTFEILHPEFQYFKGYLLLYV